MAGYDLKEGKYDARKITEDDMWSAFSRLFSTKTKNDSSYKFGFLKSIIDNLYNVDNDLNLTFDQIFEKFTEIYWNLILKYRLRQKPETNDHRLTYLEQILNLTAEKYHICQSIPFEGLTREIMSDITHQVKMKCKKYVVGAVFEDTNGIFYSFSKKEELLQINPCMYDFICKHKVIIEKLNYYAWAKFLERVNDEATTTKLLGKIDESSKRINLSVYRKILFDEFETHNCFYCGKKLRPGEIDVDHFVPWSFIKDDNLWNMVLACPSCNRRKNDRLPDKAYLSALIERNNGIERDIYKAEMLNYDSTRLDNVYKWAFFNGYDTTWRPEKREDKMSSKNSQRKWDREEVVILVSEYFRTKTLSKDEIENSYIRISKTLKKREEEITGRPVSEIFRNYAGIKMQSGRIRCLDPDTEYYGMKGTRLQSQIVQEYLDNPERIKSEAEDIFKRYDK